MADLVVVAGLDGRILFCNAAVRRTLGYTSEDLCAMYVPELFPDAHRAEGRAAFEAAVRGELDSSPIPLARWDGVLVPADTRLWRGRWSGADCLFCLCKNLTYELEAEQRFERLFRNNPTPMALSTVPGRRFADVNDAFLDVLGYAAPDVIGKTSSELGLFVSPAQQSALADRLLADGRVAGVELQVRRSDGTVLDGLFSGEVFSSQGQKSILTVMVDITEQKRAEAELFQTNLELEAATLRANQLTLHAELASITTRRPPAARG
jgi:PAS domain S-box-containing protein